MAIAVFGVVMLYTFGYSFASTLNSFQLDPAIRTMLNEQIVKLGGMELPATIDPATRTALTEAIAKSFVLGFRVLMFISAGLAIGSALSAWLLIGNQEREA